MLQTSGSQIFTSVMWPYSRSTQPPSGCSGEDFHLWPKPRFETSLRWSTGAGQEGSAGACLAGLPPCFEVSQDEFNSSEELHGKLNLTKSWEQIIAFDLDGVPRRLNTQPLWNTGHRGGRAVGLPFLVADDAGLKYWWHCRARACLSHN